MLVMAHNELAKKLDSITHEDLGVAFDEGFIWEKLESRISKSPAKIEWSWFIAASLFLGVLLFPLSILEKEAVQYNELAISDLISNTSEPALVLEVAEPNMTSKNHITTNEVTSIDLKPVKRKGPELATVELPIPKLKQIDFNQFKTEKVKPQFALSDLSVIQASLENASFNERRIEKSRKLTISAQWQGSSNNDTKSTDDQVLKLKLDARVKSLN